VVKIDQTSRNKSDEILTVYLRKRAVYIHLIRIREFDCLRVWQTELSVKLNIKINVRLNGLLLEAKGREGGIIKV